MFRCLFDPDPVTLLIEPLLGVLGLLGVRDLRLPRSILLYRPYISPFLAHYTAGFVDFYAFILDLARARRHPASMALLHIELWLPDKISWKRQN